MGNNISLMGSKAQFSAHVNSLRCGMYGVLPIVTAAV